MNHTKYILIFTSDSGYGHRSAANSVSAAMQLLHPLDAHTEIINPAFLVDAPKVFQYSELHYDDHVRYTPLWYQFTYEICDSRAASSIVEKAIGLTLYRSIERVLNENKPDVILNTNLIYSEPIGAALSATGRKIPYYTVITDLADVHALWFNSHPDHYFVASEAVKQQALACHIPEKCITVSGIPVNPLYSRIKKSGKMDLRRQLGLREDLPVILAVGSRRVNQIMKYLQPLNQLNLPFQVIAGGDESLYQKMVNHTWNFPIRLLNFVNNMAEWMGAADLLLTKAGGLIVSEGLAAGLPIVLIENIPGQEEGNVRHVVENKAGVEIKNQASYLHTMNDLLQPASAQLAIMAENARKIGHPQAALTIAERLWQATEKYEPHDPQSSPNREVVVHPWI